jgi:hypothetical protein
MRPRLPHFGALLFLFASATAGAQTNTTPWPAEAKPAAATFLRHYSDLLEPLREDLGTGIYSTRTSEHFLVVYNTDHRWAQERCDVLDRTHRRFYEAFEAAGFSPRPLPDKLVCVMFERSQQFERYAMSADRINMSWSRGYYSARTNRVAFFDERGEQANAGGDTGDNGNSMTLLSATPKDSDTDSDALNLAKTTHEAAHQIAFNSGLQTRGVMYPLWVSEGLATCFELEPDGRFGPEYDNATRRRHLLTALNRGELVSLSELAGMSKLPTNDARRVTVTYAQSWGMFKFLFERRPEQLRQYLATLAAMPAGARSSDALRQEFLNAFGSIQSLEREWADFLEGLRAGR